METVCSKCGVSYSIIKPSYREKNNPNHYCSRGCANSRLRSKETRMKISKSIKKTFKNLNIKPGKTSTTLVVGKCYFCKKDLEYRSYSPRKYHADCWIKCSGGYRKGSTRGISGTYKGYWCDSSYELAFVIYNLDHNIKFERNTEKFPYIDSNGKNRNYYPDFILSDGVYVEIKNFKSINTDLKIKYFPHPIKVLYKEDLEKFILPYVINKYGKKYVMKYE